MMFVQPLKENTLTVRAATMDDVEAALELFNISSIAMTGAPEFQSSDIEKEWQTPGFDPEDDIRLVLTPDGQLVGYVEVWAAANPPVTPGVWGRVHPEWEGQGIGTMLLEWAEARARQAIERVPDGVRVAMHSSTVNSYEPGRQLLEGYGMELIRHFWRMAIELDSLPPLPEVPQGITIRTFEQQPDALAVYRATDEAFKDHWGHVEQPEAEGFERFTHFTLNDPDFDPTLWFLAMDGDEIAGLSLCWPNLPEDPEMGWVGTLGVRRLWRRQGLALALLHHAFGEFYRRGKARVGLGVDASSLTGATRLYEKAGMRADRQWDRYEKELRPGKDLSTQAL